MEADFIWFLDHLVASGRPVSVHIPETANVVNGEVNSYFYTDEHGTLCKGELQSASKLWDLFEGIKRRKNIQNPIICVDTKTQEEIPIKCIDKKTTGLVQCPIGEGVPTWHQYKGQNLKFDDSQFPPELQFIQSFSHGDVTLLEGDFLFLKVPGARQFGLLNVRELVAQSNTGEILYRNHGEDGSEKQFEETTSFISLLEAQRSKCKDTCYKDMFQKMSYHFEDIKRTDGIECLLEGKRQCEDGDTCLLHRKPHMEHVIAIPMLEGTDLRRLRKEFHDHTKKPPSPTKVKAGGDDSNHHRALEDIAKFRITKRPREYFSGSPTGTGSLWRGAHSPMMRESEEEHVGVGGTTNTTNAFASTHATRGRPKSAGACCLSTHFRVRRPGTARKETAAVQKDTDDALVMWNHAPGGGRNSIQRADKKGGTSERTGELNDGGYQCIHGDHEDAGDVSSRNAMKRGIVDRSKSREREDRSVSRAGVNTEREGEEEEHELALFNRDDEDIAQNTSGIYQNTDVESAMNSALALSLYTSFSRAQKERNLKFRLRNTKLPDPTISSMMLTMNARGMSRPLTSRRMVAQREKMNVMDAKECRPATAHTPHRPATAHTPHRPSTAHTPHRPSTAHTPHRPSTAIPHRLAIAETPRHRCKPQFLRSTTKQRKEFAVDEENFAQMSIGEPGVVAITPAQKVKMGVEKMRIITIPRRRRRGTASFETIDHLQQTVTQYREVVGRTPAQKEKKVQKIRIVTIPPKRLRPEENAFDGQDRSQHDARPLPTYDHH